MIMELAAFEFFFLTRDAQTIKNLTTNSAYTDGNRFFFLLFSILMENGLLQAKFVHAMVN